jgi:peptide/nickel transport system ATP-binding protein
MVGVSVNSGTITLSPDPSLLTATTAFPVYIDPAITFHPDAFGGSADWTEVESGFPAQPGWHQKGPEQVGFCGWDGCNGVGVTRSIFQFAVGPLRGADIISAQFNVTEVHAPACTGQGDVTMNLFFASAAINAGTNWNNQPAVSGGVVGSNSAMHGYDSTCPAAGVGFNITTPLKTFIGRTGGTVAFILRADNEDNKFGWKQLSDTATWSTTYDVAPATPFNPKPSPAIPCTSTPANATIGKTDLTLSIDTAKASDGVSKPLNVEIQVTNTATGVVVSDHTIQTTTGSWATVALPQGTFATGNYSWRAQATDGFLLSSEPVSNAIVLQLSQDDTVIAQRLIADSGNDKFAFGASFVAPAQLAQLSGNPSARSRLVTSDAGAIVYLALNTQKGPAGQRRRAQGVPVRRGPQRVPGGVGGQCRASRPLRDHLDHARHRGPRGVRPLSDPAGRRPGEGQATARRRRLPQRPAESRFRGQHRQQLRGQGTGRGRSTHQGRHPDQAPHPGRRHLPGQSDGVEGHLRPHPERLAARLPQPQLEHPAVVRVIGDRRGRLQPVPLLLARGRPAHRRRPGHRRPDASRPEVGGGRPSHHAGRAHRAADLLPQLVPPGIRSGQLLRRRLPRVPGLPENRAQPVTLLDVRGVTVAFGGIEVVSDVSYTVGAGEVVAVVGESGSGKTVTAMSLLRLLPPTATVTGSALLGGRDLFALNGPRLRAVRGGEVGFVFQEPTSALNPVFTVGAQLVESITTHRNLTNAAAHTRAEELLTLVGLPGTRRMLRAHPHELSGGQAQRVVIAMAVANDPALLIADEPTTALDVTVQAEILELLRDLRSRLGVGILLITHGMGVVADLADRVVVMHDGRVVEQGTVTEIFTAARQEYTRQLLGSVVSLSGVPSPPPEHGAGDVVRREGSHVAVTAHPATRSVPDDDPTDEPTLSVKGLSVVYGGRFRSLAVRALDRVDLHIGAGEVLGLVGESGSGKSTLARAVVGLEKPSHGQIMQSGRRLDRLDRKKRKALLGTIGMVFQDPGSSLNPRATIGASVAEPLRLHTELRGADIDRRVTEVLDAVALPSEMASRYPHELSGGQRQRIGIARAIVLRRKLLIADEPTSALDVSVQARILTLLRDLQTQQRFACLFISHDLAVVEQLASRVAVLHRGHVVEQGPTAKVLATPLHPYTYRLVTSAPVADPAEATRRREALRSARI